MPQIVDHIHTWVKWKKFFGELHFKCDHPECFLTAPKSKIVGKRTTCASCHIEEFTLTPRHLKMSRPRCINCSQSKEAKEKRELQGKLKDVLAIALEEKNEGQINHNSNHPEHADPHESSSD